MPFKVLLTTTVTWPFAARLAASFAELGALVDAFVPRGHALAKSRHLAASYVYHPLSAQPALRAAIAASKPDFVVPCDDRALAQIVVAWRGGDRSVATLIARSLGNPASYKHLTRRDVFIAEAAALGLPVPKTERIATARELDDRAPAYGFPLVLKRDGSWGGDGVSVANTPDEMHAAWNKLSRTPSLARGVYRSIDRKDIHQILAAFERRAAVSIQAFVPGRPATTSFACRNGRVLAALHFDVVVTSYARGPATVLRRVDDATMDEAARQIAGHFGLSGLHGLDFMRDAGGVPRLIECNPRATPTAHLSFGEGHDPVAALAAAAFDYPVGARARSGAGETVALFPQEWRRDPASAYLCDAYHDVPWDDPALLKALIGDEPAQALLARWRMPAAVVNSVSMLEDASRAHLWQEPIDASAANLTGD